MKTAIAWRYRTKISLAPKPGYASCKFKKCLPKGRQRAFHLLLKVSKRCWRLLVRVDRWGWDSGGTLLPLTLPHEGGRWEQRTRSILLELFLLFFPLNKHVETRVLTCIHIRWIYLALKTWFKRQDYWKLSAFKLAFWLVMKNTEKKLEWKRCFFDPSFAHIFLFLILS